MQHLFATKRSEFGSDGAGQRLRPTSFKALHTDTFESLNLHRLILVSDSEDLGRLEQIVGSDEKVERTKPH